MTHCIFTHMLVYRVLHGHYTNVPVVLFITGLIITATYQHFWYNHNAANVISLSLIYQTCHKYTVCKYKYLGGKYKYKY